MGAGDSKIRIMNNYFFIDQSVDDNLSEALFKGHLDICGLLIPATFTSTAVSFQGSLDGTTYGVVTWNGSALSLTVATGQLVMFDPAYLSGVPWVKLGTGSGEAGDRIVYPVFRSFV